MVDKIKDIRTADKTRVISWEAPEDVYLSKNRSWYIGAIILGLGLMVVFFFMQQYAGMAVVFAAALALYSQTRVKTGIIKYTISKDGVTFHEKTIGYDQLKSFWVAEGTVFHKLYLEKTGIFSVPLIIYLSKVDPEEIRIFLRQYLPESEIKKGNLQENIFKIFRF